MHILVYVRICMFSILAQFPAAQSPLALVWSVPSPPKNPTPLHICTSQNFTPTVLHSLRTLLLPLPSLRTTQLHVYYTNLYTLP